MEIGTNLFLSHSKHPSQVMSAASITCRRSWPAAELCKAVGPSRSFNNRSSWSTAKLQPGQLQKPQKPEQLEQLQKVEKKRVAAPKCWGQSALQQLSPRCSVDSRTGAQAPSSDSAGSPSGLANGAIPPSNAADNHPLVFVGTNMESARHNPSGKKPQLRRCKERYVCHSCVSHKSIYTQSLEQGK